MERQERSILQKRYAGMADAELQDMLREGKDAYTPEAFSVLREECRKRGLENEEAGEHALPGGEVLEPVHEAPGVEPENFVTIMVVAHPDDREYIEKTLGGAGIRFFLTSMSLRGDELPASLVVEEPRFQEAIKMIQDYGVAGSIKLW